MTFVLSFFYSFSFNKTDSIKDVEKLIEVQQFKEAEIKLLPLIKKAKDRNNQVEYAELLVKKAQLQIGLHGHETALKELKNAPWPKDFKAYTMVALVYAHSLKIYYDSHSWEIRKREKKTTKDSFDLKSLTAEEIYAEAFQTYSKIWSRRNDLDSISRKSFTEIISVNNYPSKVRSELRDSVTYLLADLLANSAGWSTEHSNETYLLSVSDLLSGKLSGQIQDIKVHPLVRIMTVLRDLEKWHIKRKEFQAALEARFEMFRKLSPHLTSEIKQTELQEELLKEIGKNKKYPWVTMGYAFLAKLLQGSNKIDGKILAIKYAQMGSDLFSDSEGAKQCRDIIKNIQKPSLHLSGMNIDGAKKRSLKVTYANLKKIYFKSIKVDFKKFILSTKDYSLRPNWKELQSYLREAPAYKWSADLIETKDYHIHQAYITPPAHKNGFYVLIASGDEEFKKSPSQGIHIFISDLTFNIKRIPEYGKLSVEVTEGETGRAFKGADVFLYKVDYKKGAEVHASEKTNREGIAHFDTRSIPSTNMFVMVERGDNLIASKNPIYSFLRQNTNREVTSSFIYTDRSIYRPEQKIFWKVVSYRGKKGEEDFRVVPQIDLKVYLKDANHDVVITKTVRTNSFGSASGDFVIPSGKLLGNWSIQTSHGDGLMLKVEEYKRPTFLVEIFSEGEEARLNREVAIKGKAKYYFGNPLNNGKFKWTVERTVNLPWWCFWGGMDWGSFQSPKVLASGQGLIKPDGSFEVRFTPTADEALGTKSNDISYGYQFKIDVTNEGGETQSTEYVTTIGTTAVKASIALDKSFYLENDSANFSVSRTDLNGRFIPGDGKWTLYRLKSPKKTFVPGGREASERLKKMEANQFKHPDDFKLDRWEVNYSPESELREWKNGPALYKGKLLHEKNITSSATIKKLMEGPYRLTYKTKDSFGGEFEVSQEFFVVKTNSQFNLAAFLSLERKAVEVGQKARILVFSGLKNQQMILETHRSGKVIRKQILNSGKDSTLIELPIKEEDLGGLGLTLRLQNDYQDIRLSKSLTVPWSNKEVEVEFSSFRDKLSPGSKEKWSLKLKPPKGKKIDPEDFELVSYMYDKSLDSFTPHLYPTPLQIYPNRSASSFPESQLGGASNFYIYNLEHTHESRESTTFSQDYIKFYPNYAIGGPGSRKGGAMMSKAMMFSEVTSESMDAGSNLVSKEDIPKEEAKIELRSNFSESAYFFPHLTLDRSGATTFEFTVPDSLTSWSVWAHALSKDLKSGSLHKEVKTIKELMVRPYLPRFLREGDEVDIKVVIDNTGDRELSGDLQFEILDRVGKKSLSKDFKVKNPSQKFKVSPQKSQNLTYKLKVPVGIQNISVKVVANSGSLSDGEIKPLPILPGRMHLAESKFVTLKNKTRKEVTIPHLAKPEDPTLAHDLFVVTVDAQLFYSVLSSLPYLVNYPYKSTDQLTYNFVSSGILSSVFKEFPDVAKMAKNFSQRKTRLEKWDEPDPNRKISLEEAPWLSLAKGNDSEEELMTVLHPDIAQRTSEKSLYEIKKSQTASGGFPWFPGGAPSPFMTLNILYQLSKALEFQIEIPKDVVMKAWTYMHQHYVKEVVTDLMNHDAGWEFVTFLNFVISQYPDDSWTGGVFTTSEQKKMLDFSQKHWKEHSPYLKSYLALTLVRHGNKDQAKVIWESVMDSSTTSEDEGTHWAQEERTWLWYNDTIETHAMAIRAGMELGTKKDQLDGMVQWLFLNKKLNQWKSTRATAEVIYALTYYLKKTKQMGLRDNILIQIGKDQYPMEFKADKYTGKKNQIIYPAEKISSNLIPVSFNKTHDGLAFGSVTWHYSTEKLPKEGVGDFFKLDRKFYKRVAKKGGYELKLIKEGDKVDIGDEIEVQISIQSKHQAEYVHLKDPRASGFEPIDGVSTHKWEFGLSWYEEIRDSGTNFFFEKLPQGQYTFRYRIRASTAGEFKTSPATIQPLYAPEFYGFSQGHILHIQESKR